MSRIEYLGNRIFVYSEDSRRIFKDEAKALAYFATLEPVVEVVAEVFTEPVVEVLEEESTAEILEDSSDEYVQ